jgi:hypothetical protein
LICGKAFSKTSPLSRTGPHNLAPSGLERLEREIAATDAEIDNLFYKLYRITDEERRVIEGQA